MAEPIDTNVVVRFLVETPDGIAEPFKGVFSFFEKLERGERRALLPPLVLFQTYFVLTSYYGVPRGEAAEKLRHLIAFRGLTVPERPVLRKCLQTVVQGSSDFVDAYLAALCGARQQTGIFSFDEGLRKLGLDLLPID
jgi:predicted nucleic acid-binding protein